MPPAVQNPAQQIILASASATRATLLRNAGLRFDIEIPRIDEAAIRAGLLAEAATPRDIVDVLAETKARRIAFRHPAALVIGCDQILVHQGQILTKPGSPADAVGQLAALAGQTHTLLSAVVLYDQAEPVWRHIGQADMTMRPMTRDALQTYVDRNWDSIRDAVGCYQIEAEGAWLFSRIDGDYFSILGLPLIDLLSCLVLRGTLPT